MSEDDKALEHELAELVKRSRALSVEMSEISEKMLQISAELTRRQIARAKGREPQEITRH